MCGLRPQTTIFHYTHFFPHLLAHTKKKLEKVTVWEKVGSQEVFYFPKIKQFHPLDSTNSLQDTRYTRTSLSSTQIAGFTAFFVFRFWTHKMGSVENFAIYLSKLLLQFPLAERSTSRQKWGVRVFLSIFSSLFGLFLGTEGSKS